MPNPENFSLIYNVLLTSGVFAALITSVVNIVLLIVNNTHLKKIERIRWDNEIIKYRYVKLYEFCKEWHNYEIDIDDVLEIGDEEYVKMYADLLGSINSNIERYRVVKPLLDRSYTEELDELLNEIHLKEKEIILMHDSMSKEEYHRADEEMLNLGVDFSKKLKKDIDNQLTTLISSN